MKDIADADRAHLLHPFVPFAAHEKRGPNVVTGGKGIRIFTDAGELIDGLSGLFNINVGHGRTEIADAVNAQMKKQAYYPSFWGYSVDAPIRLAERLAGGPRCQSHDGGSVCRNDFREFR